MQRFYEGETTFEQLPSSIVHPERKSRIAFWSIVVVFILFGAFWYYEHRQQSSVEIPTDAAQISHKESAAINLTDLQAAAINTAIPTYSEEF